LGRRNTAQGRENEENHSSCKIVARWLHAGTGAAQEVTSDEFDLGAWITQFRDAKAGAAVLSLVGTLDKPYDLLLGRKTYDIFAGHWPRFLPTIQLGLCSQSEQICTNPGSTKFDWANSHKLSSIDELKKVKSEAGGRYCPVGKLNTVSAAA
jgi:hypothetical protein